MNDLYKESGVDINSGNQISKFIKDNVEDNSENIGSFGAICNIPNNIKNPVVVSSNDGVGTKLLLTNELKKWDTIGIDCVAMCVNDLLAQGAIPSSFMDYIAVSKIDSKVNELLKGIIKGCQLADIKLIGGETAEMPGVYSEDRFDIAGFSMGIVEKEKLFKKDNVKSGDVLIGIKSSGVHSNGFSLIRKILFKDYKLNINSLLWDDCNKTIGQILIEPTKIYTNEMKPLIEQNIINGAAHITGGGLLENVLRMFNDNLSARINLDSWQIPNVFQLLKDYGNIDDFEMYRDFNMGIGMVISVSADNVSSVMKTFQNQNKADDAIVIGKIIPKSDSSVELVR